MIETIEGPVHTMNRAEPPPQNETISDDMDLDELLKVINKFTYHFRDKESCPFNRGNWVLDFFNKDQPNFPMFSLKLPPSMKKEEVERWIRPLIEKMKEKMQ